VVFARGVVPVPGAKAVVHPLDEMVLCGGVNVAARDIVIADEDGIVVTAHADRDQVLRDARAMVAEEAGESLEAWEASHRTRIDKILGEHGFSG
jgi:4-hydroxy-4-methyl-2-oxoglutarate aldolase